MRILSEYEINRIFKGKNFFTQSVTERRQLGEVVYELSTGPGIFGTGVYGVSVRDLDGNHIPVESKLFYNEQESREYIRSLQVLHLLES